MKKLFFVSLGCDKNLVESEYMLGALAKSGYIITDDETEADAIIINTCSFIHDAKDESVQSILEMAEYKKEGKCKALVVAGCLAQQFGQDILDELEEVDAVIGTNSYDDIAEVLERVYSGERIVLRKPLEGHAIGEGSRLLTTGGHYAYLKIAEGCDKHCTYCVIPTLRGKFRSVPLENVIKEAKELADKGVTELNIVAQETTLYGKDLYGEKILHKLLDELCDIDDIKRIRLMYCYPEEIYPELIQTIAKQDKICNYLDIPIQHCNDKILRSMGRKTSKKDLEDIIASLRKAIPDIVLRTSLITGFPGETEDIHEELMDFVADMEFDRLGVFSYSKEDGTPAAEFSDQIDEELKEARKEEIMLLQQQIAFEKNKEKIGLETEVFVEGYLPQDDVYVGRTYGDAPNVDGYIFFNSNGARLQSGQYVNCKITDFSDYDLIGEMINE